MRLGLLEKKHPQMAKNLMGIKWLGNTGTHDHSVTSNDLLGAYKVMSHALDELVEKKSAAIARTARQLTAKHKRVRPRKK